MALSRSQNTRKTYLRLATSGLVSLQMAIFGTVASEIIATQPQISNARVAYAQNSAVQAVEAATVYIETDRGSSGSGVIIDSSGLVVTSAHVIEGARQISIRIQGREYNASVVSMGDARCLDLALVQIEGAQDFSAATLGDIEDIYKTQDIFAIGFPLSLSRDSPTITRGIVSNIHQNWGELQIDGPINPGNSGGPVVNNAGEVIGIVAWKRADAEGTNFAVSIDKVAAFINAYRHNVFIPTVIMPGSAPSEGVLSRTLSTDGVSVEGSLQEGDSRLCSNSGLSDLYTFDAEAGQNIMLELSNADMGGHIFLVAPDGEVIATATAQRRDQSAYILEKLTRTGTYTVMASAADFEHSGDYELRATQPILVEAGLVHSSLAPCSDTGQRCLRYQFHSSAQQAITLMLQSEFAPYVELVSPAGEVVLTGPSDRQLVGTITLEEEGWYTLVVATQESEGQGNVFVSVHDTESLNPSVEVSRR